MSARDLIVFAVILGSVPFCLTRPWIGVLVFSWIGYMNPHRYTWGMAYDFPFAQIIAIATIAGFIFTKDKDKLYFEIETKLIIFLWVLFTFTSFFAFYPSHAWPMWQKTTKVFLMCLLTIPLFIDKAKLKWLMVTIALSLGLLGVKGAVFTVLTGGAHNVRGPDFSFIAGEGDFALALNMALPVIYYLGKMEERKRLKLFYYAVFIMTMASVIFTYRRGGFIGLAVVLLMLAFKARKKYISAIVLGVLVISAPFFLTEQWYERMETLKTYEEDQSSMGRINAWKMAYNVAKDRPLTGAGFDGLRWGIIDRYSPDPDRTASDVHSVYFEVLGEHGFVAFGAFALLIMYSMRSLQTLKKTFRDIPSAEWIMHYADMLQISIIAYMVGGAFLGRAYFDLFYHIIVVIVILKILARNELASLNQPAVTA